MAECTLSAYFDSKQSILDKIKAYNALIDLMHVRATEVASGMNASIDEYSMDDGQMKVRTKYRNIDDLINGIAALEKMRQMYMNRHNGRAMVMRDIRSFN